MNALLFAVTGTLVVTGQLSLAGFARGLQPPWTVGGIATQALLSWKFYVALGAYAVGLAAYLVLLRRLTIAEVTLPLIVIVVALTLLAGAVIGETLTPTQWLGVLVAMIGITLFHV